jgi:hypothetical protein
MASGRSFWSLVEIEVGGEEAGHGHQGDHDELGGQGAQHQREDDADDQAHDGAHDLAGQHPVDGPSRRVAGDVQLAADPLRGVRAGDPAAEGGRLVLQGPEDTLLERLVQLARELGRRVGHRLQDGQRAGHPDIAGGVDGRGHQHDRQEDESDAEDEENDHVRCPP